MGKKDDQKSVQEQLLVARDLLNRAKNLRREENYSSSEIGRLEQELSAREADLLKSRTEMGNLTGERESINKEKEALFKKLENKDENYRARNELLEQERTALSLATAAKETAERTLKEQKEKVLTRKEKLQEAADLLAGEMPAKIELEEKLNRAKSTYAEKEALAEEAEKDFQILGKEILRLQGEVAKGSAASGNSQFSPEEMLKRTEEGASFSEQKLVRAQDDCKAFKETMKPIEEAYAEESRKNAALNAACEEARKAEAEAVELLSLEEQTLKAAERDLAAHKKSCEEAQKKQDQAREEKEILQKNLEGLRTREKLLSDRIAANMEGQERAGKLIGTLKERITSDHAALDKVKAEHLEILLKTPVLEKKLGWKNARNIKKNGIEEYLRYAEEQIRKVEKQSSTLRK